MEIVIAYPETPEKAEAIKAILKVLKISYEIEQDTTEYLLSTEANKKALEESMSQIREGKNIKVNLDEIGK